MKTSLHLYKFIIIFLLIILDYAQASTPIDTLVIARRIDDLITLDPAAMFENSAGEYAVNTYERLVGYDPKTPEKFYGIIAKNWNISPDGLTYTFNIYENLKFVSGNPITADDVVFSLHRAILLQKTSSFILSQFGFNKDNINTRIIALSPTKIQLIFEEIFAPNLILNCLTAPIAAIVDKKVVLAHQENNDLGHKWLTNHHAGSGLFTLKTWIANEILYLEKNPYANKPTKLKTVIIRHVNEAATQKLLLEQNDIDVARNLQINNIQQLNKRLKLLTTPKNSLVCLTLNQKNPYLRQEKVRQAIKYLINYHQLKEKLYHGLIAIHQSFIPNNFFAADTSNPFQYNLAKAKTLLTEAGLTQGFSISLMVEPNRLMLAQTIQASFKEAKINVAIIPGDSKQVLTKFRERNYDAIITCWGADYQDPHSNAASFTKNFDNSAQNADKTLAWRANWEIPQLTQLTLQAAHEPNLLKRKLLYATLQQEFFKKSPIIVLFQEVEITAINAKAAELGIGIPAGTNLMIYDKI